MFITIKAEILYFFTAVSSQCIVTCLHRMHRHLRSCPIASAVTAGGKKESVAGGGEEEGKKRNEEEVH